MTVGSANSEITPELEEAIAKLLCSDLISEKLKVIALQKVQELVKKQTLSETE